MMLTPEQLAAVAKINFGDAMAQTTVKKLLAHIDAQQERIAELGKAAARYRQLRRGQQWSVIDGIGDALRADDLDAAIDAAMQPTWPEDTSDYGSRIAAIGQNGNDGLHYAREQEGGKDASA